MEIRPKIKIEPGPVDRILEITGWTVLGLMWVLIVINYSRLPETIPTHFNGAGQADNYGGKGTILLLPVMGTILYIGLTFLNRFPRIFNYPIPITPENAERQYRNAVRLIRFIKFIVLFIFLVIELQTIRMAMGHTAGLGAWFMPVTLGIVFVPIIFYLITAVKAKKK